MAREVINSEQEIFLESEPEKSYTAESRKRALTEYRVARMRALWNGRVFLFRVAGCGLAIATATAFLIPPRYESTVHLMPPDMQSNAMLAALGSKVGGGLASLGGDMLGLKNSGALFVGILQSRTMQDELIAKFGLRRAYSTERWDVARIELAKVEEAKEIPAVKVLDAAVVPTKKSFAPRTLIVACGTTFALAVDVAWIVGRARWDALDGDDPGKLLAQEVFSSVRARIPPISKKSARPSAGDAEATIRTGNHKHEEREPGS